MNGHVWGMVIAMLIADALDRLCASLGFKLAQGLYLPLSRIPSRCSQH